MSKRLVYMDHNATTPLHPEVRKAVEDVIDIFGNPSSLHSFGRAAAKYVDEARERLSLFIGASDDEIIFTSSGSEGNNTVLNSFYLRSRELVSREGQDEGLIISSIEHPCVLEKAESLISKGAQVYKAAVDRYGKIDIENYKRLFKNKIGLVSIMLANNEVGTIQDIRELSDIAHENGAFFHTDAVQAIGKIPVNVNDLGVDFLTVSGHKIYGPKGIGALYVRKGVPYHPLLLGGHQEKERRAGTENTHGIIGLAKAVEMAKIEMQGTSEKLLNLKRKLKHGIEKEIKDIKFNGHEEDSLPGVLNVSFKGAEGELILLYLDMAGIAVSTGSACSSGSVDPSHVLIAMRLDIDEAQGAIRFSLGRGTSEEDVDYVLEKLPQAINRVKGLNGVYAKT